MNLYAWILTVIYVKAEARRITSGFGDPFQQKHEFLLQIVSPSSVSAASTREVLSFSAIGERSDCESFAYTSSKAHCLEDVEYKQLA
jgi:hypothetical protein